METLPYDVDTEDAILGAVITFDSEFEDVYKYFTNIEVLYQKRAQLLWKKIIKLKREGQKTDLLTICNSLTKKETEEG